MPRLHWFWRGTIAAFAVLAAGMLGGCYGWWLWDSQAFHQYLLDPAWNLMVGPGAYSPLGTIVYNAVFYHVPPVAAGVAMYVGIRRLFCGGAMDHETRCRKCGYILRGITEPRCPECGERI